MNDVVISSLETMTETITKRNRPHHFNGALRTWLRRQTKILGWPGRDFPFAGWSTYASTESRLHTAAAASHASSTHSKPTYSHFQAGIFQPFCFLPTLALLSADALLSKCTTMVLHIVPFKKNDKAGTVDARRTEPTRNFTENRFLTARHDSQILQCVVNFQSMIITIIAC